MTVVLVLPSRGDPAHGRVARELARALRSRGHRVRVYAPPDGARPAAARRGLEGLLRRLRPEVCHVQFFARGLAWLDALRLAPASRLVVSFQGAAAELIEHPAVFRRLAARAWRVTAVSRAGLRDLGARFAEIPRKGSVVPNGVRLRADPPAPRTAPRRRPFVLCVGRLAAYKGIDVLAMAFAGLAGRRGLDLVVCGPDQTGGRLGAFIERLRLRGRVSLAGPVSPGRAERLMRGCLFFVLPSRREGMPMALLEAMAAGKAIVAARTGGVPEAVAHGRSALLVPPGDAAALARAMETLASDEKLRARLGRAARRRARRFSWSSAAAAYEAVYREERRR